MPLGAVPPSWPSGPARVAGLDRIGRDGLIGISWLLVLLTLAAFAVVLVEAWSGRVRLPAVLAASGMSLAVSVAAPLLLSRDVYTYAAYGRIDAVYHRNPYVTTLSSYPHDRFVSVTSAQWLHTHSVYGPVFTLLSAAIARLWVGSPSATILAFKLLAGIAIAAATGFVARVAARTRPGRAPFAAALVGLNPVLVIHTVGGGHSDALIAAPLAVALWIAASRPRRASAGAVAVTVLLTVACLIKGVILPALALWVWWIARTNRDKRRRTITVHVAAIAVLVLVSVAPFQAGWHTLAPFATLGGVEVWASPSHLVGHVVQAIVASFAGSTVGADSARVTEGAFLLLYVVLVGRLARRSGGPVTTSPADLWGVALLLLALSMPFLLPWYVAWFAPFVGLFADEALVLAGALATGVLALTLIPADPFHGRTSAPVMNGVHYGAATALLVALLVVVARVWVSTGSGGNRRATLIATPEENELGSAVIC
jgi:alpha-1,6-mannosyltransferase